MGKGWYHTVKNVDFPRGGDDDDDGKQEELLSIPGEHQVIWGHFQAGCFCREVQDNVAVLGSSSRVTVGMNHH